MVWFCFLTMTKIFNFSEPTFPWKNGNNTLQGGSEERRQPRYPAGFLESNVYSTAGNYFVLTILSLPDSFGQVLPPWLLPLHGSSTNSLHFLPSRKGNCSHKPISQFPIPKYLINTFLLFISFYTIFYPSVTYIFMNSFISLPLLSYIIIEKRCLLDIFPIKIQDKW